MSELICHQRKPTQTKHLEENKETRNVVMCGVGGTGLIWTRRKWYETKWTWCFSLGDECMCPFTQAAPMRSLDVWTRGGLLCSQTQLYRKQIPCIYSLHQREETFCCYYEVPLFSNHSTSHCSVRCSRHSLAVLNKAKFVFTLLISPGRILIISEKVWQRCDLKKRLIFAINFIKDNEVIL